MFELLNDYPVILAIAIFCARVVDVSMGTVRVLVGFRGYRLLAALIGFCEAAIWILAASRVIMHLDQWYLIVAYAGGFATGTFVGITLEKYLGVGRELVRIIAQRETQNLALALTDAGYTVVELSGTRRNHDPVQVLYIVEKRRRVPLLIKLIAGLDDKAIITVTDVKSSQNDVHDGTPQQQRNLKALLSKRK